MIKRFIEVIDTKDVRHLININYIEEIEEGDEGGGCWIYLAHNCPNATEQDYYRTSEPYEVIKRVLMGG